MIYAVYRYQSYGKQIGWAGYLQKSFEEKRFTISSVWARSMASGKHCILELYRANSSKLNDEAFVREALAEAARVSNATLLDISTHKFEPQGVTGFALLAESHISIHTWPEHEYAAVDVFTCGDTTDPELACTYLMSQFEARSKHILTLDRYLPEAVAA